MFSGNFNHDFPIVSRPIVSSVKTQPHENNTDKKSRHTHKSQLEGYKLLVNKNRTKWKPKFILGESATPSRQPKLNIPRLNRPKLKISTHQQQHNYQSSNEPLSPYEYSQVENNHDFELEHSKSTTKYLKDFAVESKGYDFTEHSEDELEI